MSLSSPPPRFADRELSTSGRRVRALRGHEEIARLTARLRSEHNEYESASPSWSPEADEKKRELRKARADTLVEIGAALTWLGEMTLLREIERLPFEQKLRQLEAFLEDAQGGSAAPSQEGNTPVDAVPHPVAQLEALLEDTQGGSTAPSQGGSTPPDAIQRPVAEPSIAPPEPEATREAPWAAGESTRLASMLPRSMRPRSRRSIGHWPLRLAASAMPRAATSRVPLLVGVIAVQGLALAVLAFALLRVTLRSSQSDPSRAATSSAAATAMAAPLPPPATEPARSGTPSYRAAVSPQPHGLPVAAPSGEPRPMAAAQTPRPAVPPPRAKPSAVPSPPTPARRPDTFIPDRL
jgi:hypothetical protein